MSIYSKLYLLTKLDNIYGFIIFIGILLCFITVALIIWYNITKYEDICDFSKVERRLHSILLEKIKHKVRLIIPFCVLFLILMILFPSKRDIIFIIAGGKTIEFIQNDTNIKKIPNMTTEYLYEILDKKINELNTIK